MQMNSAASEVVRFRDLLTILINLGPRGGYGMGGGGGGYTNLGNSCRQSWGGRRRSQRAGGGGGDSSPRRGGGRWRETAAEEQYAPDRGLFLRSSPTFAASLQPKLFSVSHLEMVNWSGVVNSHITARMVNGLSCC